MRDCIVIAGGDPPLPGTRQELPSPAWVVAADSGFDHAAGLGLEVDLIIGDMDSVSSEGAVSRTARISHPADKDQTDLELALRHVAAHESVQRIVVVGGFGGRFDHTAVNLGLLAADWLETLDLEWIAGAAKCHVIRDVRRIHGDPGEIISLVPVGGDAIGITTKGMKWALDNEDLPAGSTRGAGNILTGSVATVKVRSGTLLAIQPNAVK